MSGGRATSADRDRALLAKLMAELRVSRRELDRLHERIAIIGLGCRFPGGEDPYGFWTRLASGDCTVTRGRPDDLTVEVAGTEPAPWGAYVPELDRFDAAFFQIAPVEAELMDPQQRMLLETSWEALEDAGMDPVALAGQRVGVYAGLASCDYYNLVRHAAPSLYLATGNSFAAAIGRVAFTLGLRGPAIAVDTACSASLVAIHQAVAGLLRGDADLALAGGVNAILARRETKMFEAAGMLSADGRCRTFDAAADGYVRGEGCGVLVLKRLSEAERDGDRILGVVLGSAVNQDGASAGFTVPNGPAQEDVIREALSRAGVSGTEVDYLEAHGTGTELGDPIEVQAAAAVYGERRDSGSPLLLGSVKTNIGHLESAAGVAGVIKVLLAMRHRLIPKHLHFETPNPRIDWAALPVRVTAEVTPWPETPGRPMRAGVSAFGFSGTNAHVVLESYGNSGEAPGVSLVVAVPGWAEPPAEAPERRTRVLPLSGRSGAAVSALAGRYLGWLDERDRDWEGLSDGSWTAGVGRSHFGRRAGVVFSDRTELRDQLEALASRVLEDAPAGEPGKVAFLFTGQGSQWVGMGRDLYEREPVFREVLDRAEGVIREERGESLLSVMFGGENGSGSLDGTEWTQPALFALQGALSALWRSVGVVPDAVLGHSVGEISAAHAAGVFGFEEGLRFASRRGALMGSLPCSGRGSGRMVAVFAPVSEVLSAVSELNAGSRGQLDLAAENGMHQVVSGPPGLTGRLSRRFTAAGRRVERLSVSHAFHSSQMDSVLDELEEAASGVGFRAPSVPLVAGATGRLAGVGEVEERAYWRRQARLPVRFVAGIETLAGVSSRVLIELGPRAALGPIAALSWPAGEGSAEGPVLVSSQGGPGVAGDEAFARAVAGTYEAGLPVSFESLYGGERRRRVSVPTYPFRRERHWVQTKDGTSDAGVDGAAGGMSSAGFLGNPESAASEAGPLSRVLRAEGVDPDEVGLLFQSLEELSRSYALSALRTLGWNPSEPSVFAAEGLRQELGVVEQHRGLFGRLLTMLRDGGILSVGDGASEWLVASRTEDAPPPVSDSPDELAAGLLSRNPDGRVEIALLRRCGEALPDVLRGRIDGLELLFSGDPDAGALYREAPLYRAMNRAARESVKALIGGLPDGRRLRVLEVGAGTGGTTEAVLSAVPAGRTDYTYTDISAAFFETVEERFADSGVSFAFRVLDIERDPGDQAFEPHRHDVVVAANVLHATRDVAESLRHCRRLLSPSGVLVLMEGAERHGWLDLTFGLLPGWWRFADGYRADHPLLPVSEWRRALDDAGFGESGVVDGGPLGALLLVRGPEVVRPEARTDSPHAPETGASSIAARLREAAFPARLKLLRDFLAEQVRSVLRLPAPPSGEVGFFELGMDSLMAVEVRNRVNRALEDAATASTVAFDHPNVNRLAEHLARSLGDSPPADAAPAPSLLERSGQERIAVVGMACRFPGGSDTASFWSRLAAGADEVSRGRPDDLMPDRGPEDPGPWGAYVSHLDRFDAAFFRIAPVEAEMMDPQQRLLLETSWEALEDAGLEPDALRGSRTGVYAGVATRDYEHLLTFDQRDPARSLYFVTGNASAAAIGRIAFALGLRGPAITVDTACSSSLVAIHQAVTALSRGEADLALGGGVNAILSAAGTRLLDGGGMLAPDGRCKTFDDAADGYVRGEGCGVLVLKRLAEAERDGDRILGVILGSAVNQDGASAGFTVPNGPAQEAVIREALARATVEPGSVDYLEAHGTGTSLGDPIEVQAAAAVYGAGRPADRPLLLGSVKTNIGHLEAAAGVAGMVKVLLAMRQGLIPPHLHFETPNPRLDWDRLPVRVTSEATAWPGTSDRPARAAVSSFGVSGTNAHLVLEGYGAPGEAVGDAVSIPVPGIEAPAAGVEARCYRLLPLSGQTGAARAALAARYLAWLDEIPEEPSRDRLSDAAWTAGVGRRHFGARAGLVFGGAASGDWAVELRPQLEALASGPKPPREGAGPAAESPLGKVGFLFTGQASQWTGMGRDLYEREPVARMVLDRAEAVIREERGASLLDVMFGRGDASGDLDATEWTQPALYALQGALLALWRSVDVEADAVFGHSVGEIAAAHAAGVFDFEEGLLFAARRGALMGSLPRKGKGSGKMMAVFQSEAAVEAAVREVAAGTRGTVLELAAANGAHQVVSGSRAQVTRLGRRLSAQGIRTEPLPASHAFHSAVIEPVLDALEEAAAALSGAPASVPLVAGETGRVASPGDLEEASYWRRQARAPVRFADGVRTLAELGCHLLVELGPQGVLGPMASLCWPEEDGSVVRPRFVASQAGARRPGDQAFLGAVAEVYEAGVPVSFRGLYAGEARRRTSVPHYPFQRERYWLPARGDASAGEGHPLLGAWRESASGEVVFEKILSAASPGWLADHRILGRVVAPPALYAAQALAALTVASPGSPRGSLEDVTIERPLDLSEAIDDAGRAGRTVQVVLRGPESGASRRLVEVFSRGSGDGSWTLHAAGWLNPDGTPEAPDLPSGGIAALQDTLTAVSAESLREQLGLAGLALGPAFRGLIRLWAGEGEALGEVVVPPEVTSLDDTVHPALLDACFQVLGPLAESAGKEETGGGWLAAGWESLRLDADLPGRLHCRVRLRDRPDSESAGEVGTLKADFFLYREDGSAAGEVRGFGVRRTRRRRTAPPPEVGALLYQVEWEEAGETRPAASPGRSPDPGRWVVGSAPESASAARELAAELEARGQEVLVCGEDGAVARRDSWGELFRGLPADVPFAGVVHLAGIREEDPSSAQLAAAVEAESSRALALVQGLQDADRMPDRGLWLVTRGGQAIGEVAAGGLFGATLWGLGSVVPWELDGLSVRMVDLDPATAPAVGPLPLEVLFPDPERRIAYRGGRRLVARVRRSAAASGASPEPAPAIAGAPAALRDGRLHPDRTYLITGGLSGVGLTTARWLAERGAGAVLLNARSAPDASAEAAIREMRERGTLVRVELGDVTEAETIARLMGLAGGDDGALPPLGGVIHSAGVFDDVVLSRHDPARLRRVLWPKVMGAWRLHRATLDTDLELFVLFSSTASVLGHRGVAAYAAANAFVDQLAAHRRRLGLAGQAVAWGAWSEVGGVESARGRVEGYLERIGFGWLTPEQGIAALERLLRDAPARAVAARVDWSLFGAAAGTGDPLWEHLAPGAVVQVPAAAAPDALLPQVVGASRSERREVLTRFLQREVRSVLGLRSPPSLETGFFDLGMDSLMALELRDRVNRALAGEVVAPDTVVFDHPNVTALAERLADLLGPSAAAPAAARLSAVPRPREEPVAVVGMACRFPGGAGLAGFHQLLADGGDAVTDVRPDKLVPDGRESAAEDGLFGAFLPELDRFDAGFFRIAPVEAELMDPQQRLLLEVSWEALEDAGIAPAALRGTRTGVYAGITTGDYRDILQSHRPSGRDAMYLATGTSFAAAIGRVAFTLGFEGPAIAVDTACSSSLVAIHQAAAALERGEANLALAGGVNAILLREVTRLMQLGGTLAPDGRCKAFDARADGYVRGEGCGVVVLKRLSEAERDGDRILGVILGSAVNQDGASAGLTVPNGPAQEDVIREALARAGVAPSEVDYLEAHGTGTELGDPIEVQAAAAVYGEGRDPERPLLMGSVKTNLGHLEAAAGVAGVIKVLLSVREGRIPRHLHFQRPSSRIPWADLPVRVTGEPTPWPSPSERPVRAGVSSFGISGTNAHLVLEAYGEPGEVAGPAVSVPLPTETREAGEAQFTERRYRVLPLSGRSGPALSALAGRYREWLGEDGEVSAERLADAAWTAGVGRNHFGVRAGLAFADGEELREQLGVLASGGAFEGAPGGEPGSHAEAGKVAFLFTGQGSQWVGMGRDLYEREPVFREVLDRAERVIREVRGESLLSVLFGGAGDLDGAFWAQPAVFALQGGLVALWRGVGVEPAAVLGHSLGEVGAACAAGVFGFEEGLVFAARRGALLGSLPRSGRGSGGMLAVFAPLPEVMSAISALNAAARGQLDLAAENGMHQVVSGPRGLLGKLSRRFEGLGVRVEPLSVSPAGHSSLVEPVLGGLEEAASELRFEAPAIPLVTGVTGRPAGAGEVEDGAYWRRQTRTTVRFATGVESLASLGSRVLIELGPRGVLGPMAALSWPAGEGSAGPPVLVSSQGGSEVAGDRGFADAVTGAYEAGLAVAFEGLYGGERRRRVSVPAYPFQRERYWVRGGTRPAEAAGHPLLGVRRESPRGEVSFEISTGALSWMEDHRVFGRVVAPAAFYGAQALSVIRDEAGPGRTGALERLRIERPLVLAADGAPDGSPRSERVVQLVLGELQAGARPVEVFSRGAGEKTWVLHAAGRVVSGMPADPEEPISVEEMRAGLSPAPVADLYERFGANAVHHGAAFRGIRGLWAGDGEVLAEVALPEGLDSATGAVHPAFLDACLRAALGLRDEPEADASDAGRGTVWLPLGWDRLWLAGEMPDEVLSHATRRESPGDIDRGPDQETWKADLAFYRPDGTPLGGAAGLTLERSSRSALHAASAGVSDLLHEVCWRTVAEDDRPGARSAAFLADPAAVVAGLGAPEGRFRAEGLDRGRVDRLDRGVEEVSRGFALAALDELGWDRRAGAGISVEELRRELGVLEEHRNLFGRMLELLGDAGVLLPAGGGSEWRVALGSGDSGPAPPGDPEKLADDLLSRYPEGAVEIALLRRCGMALSEVLRGRADGMDLLFSGDPNMSDLYLKAPVYRAVNRAVEDAVRALLPGLPEGRRVRVLEVGAGMGGTTGAVLSALPGGRTDYTYTDISAGFFAAAEERLANAASLEFRVLDIEADPEEQGFELHRRDLVVAANVLHATRNLAESLAHCRRLLAPSGVLVLLEVVERRGFPDLTFGSLSGWWRFGDEYREGHPLVPESGWRQALADGGFEEVGAYASGVGVSVLLARSPSEVRVDPGLWVVSGRAGGEEAASCLAGELEERGQTVVAAAGTVGDGKGREEWRALFEGLPAETPLRGVVHFGFGAEPDSGFAAEAEALAALGLVQGLYDAGREPGSGLWFVTRGGQALPGDRSGGIGGAPIWGLGKVAAQEFPDFGVRLLDLDPALAPASPASREALASELLFPDHEREAAWRGGERRVARLVRRAAVTAAPARGRIRKDRSVLVTGGLGRIGLEVAHWLFECGAGGIVLNGRRAPEGEAAAAVARLAARGASVRVVVADVTDEIAVERMVAGLADSGLPPLGGLIHGAGEVRHAGLPNQDREALLRVLRPTVLGAWNLHRATLALDLELFVLFSSVAGVLGNPGQANEAAADAFVDQLARWRRERGLPGQAIAWAGWSSPGEAAARGQFAGSEPSLMTPGQGLGVLSRVIEEDAGSSVAAAADWNDIAEAMTGPSRLLEELVHRDQGAMELRRPDDLLARFARTPEWDRAALLEDFVAGEVRSVLRLAARPPPDTGFFDLGMDSLMAVELRNRVNRALAGRVVTTATFTFDYPSVREMAKYLGETIASGAPGGSPLEPSPGGNGLRPADEREPGAESWDELADLIFSGDDADA